MLAAHIVHNFVINTTEQIFLFLFILQEDK